VEVDGDWVCGGSGEGDGDGVGGGDNFVASVLGVFSKNKPLVSGDLADVDFCVVPIAAAEGVGVA
jgi:hypothetical protein